MSNGFEERFQVLHEVVAAARINLNQNIWDYLVGGTATETTVCRNRLAFDRIGFRPRVLQSVYQIDTTTQFLGHAIRLPVALAPVGGLAELAQAILPVEFVGAFDVAIEVVARKLEP